MSELQRRRKLAGRLLVPPPKQDLPRHCYAAGRTHRRALVARCADPGSNAPGPPRPSSCTVVFIGCFFPAPLGPTGRVSGFFIPPPRLLAWTEGSCIFSLPFGEAPRSVWTGARRFGRKCSPPHIGRILPGAGRSRWSALVLPGAGRHPAPGRATRSENARRIDLPKRTAARSRLLCSARLEARYPPAVRVSWCRGAGAVFPLAPLPRSLPTVEGDHSRPTAPGRSARPEEVKRSRKRKRSEKNRWWSITHRSPACPGIADRVSALP